MTKLTQRQKWTRHIVIIITILLVFLMAGSSFAYWSQELLTENEYRLATYNTYIENVFEAPADWWPGAEVNNDVSIKNEGSVPVYTKVTLNQKWARAENVYDADGNIMLPAKGDRFPLAFDAAGGREYAALIKWGKDVMLLSSGKTAVPSLSLGLPVAGSAKEAEGKWLLINEVPDAKGNLTLYYIGTLLEGESSPLLVDGVKMNGNIQAGVLENNTVWDRQARKWVATAVNNNSYSYENARYTLSVGMYTVQATRDAIKETFGADNTAELSVISKLEDLAHSAGDLDYGHEESKTQHKLSFEEVDGTMSFTPAGGNGEDESWFMSNLNMLPGGLYEHSLLIENRSETAYDLYMQILTPEQATMIEELMKHIQMKVYDGKKLIYAGTPLGEAYLQGAGANNAGPGVFDSLQTAVLLGNYSPGVEKEIRVELSLDKGTPLAYTGLLANVNWKFMVVENFRPVDPIDPIDPVDPVNPVLPVDPADPAKPSDPAKPAKPSDPVKPAPAPAPAPSGLSPKTGDGSMGGLWYVMVMAVSGISLIGCAAFLRKKSKTRRGM